MRAWFCVFDARCSFYIVENACIAKLMLLFGITVFVYQLILPYVYDNVAIVASVIGAYNTGFRGIVDLLSIT